jgi:curved DNA-binding protein CbpA
LALLHHPDKGGEKDLMGKLNEAYHILMDDKLRNDYDNQKEEDDNFASDFLRLSGDKPISEQYRKRIQ